MPEGIREATWQCSLHPSALAAPLSMSARGGGPAGPSVGYTFHCNVVGGRMRERKRDMYISKLCQRRRTSNVLTFSRCLDTSRYRADHSRQRESSNGSRLPSSLANERERFERERERELRDWKGWLRGADARSATE